MLQNEYFRICFQQVTDFHRRRQTINKWINFQCPKSSTLQKKKKEVFLNATTLKKKKKKEGENGQ